MNGRAKGLKSDSFKVASEQSAYERLKHHKETLKINTNFGWSLLGRPAGAGEFVLQCILPLRPGLQNSSAAQASPGIIRQTIAFTHLQQASTRRKTCRHRVD